MKVKSIWVMGKALSSKALRAGYQPTTDFQIKFGTILIVYSISYWENVLHYLTLDNSTASLPDWYPAELFEAVNQSLPVDWHHNYFGEDDPRGVQALWGYREMVMDYAHYNDLIERKDEAIRIFLRRKNEMEEIEG